MSRFGDSNGLTATKSWAKFLLFEAGAYGCHGLGGCRFISRSFFRATLDRWLTIR